jgi:Flp pilus assembly protein TadG
MKFTKRGEKGNAILEFGLIVPLLAPLLLLVFDFGMYAYAFISVENAARYLSASEVLAVIYSTGTAI